MKDVMQPPAPPARGPDEFFIGWLPLPQRYARFLLPLSVGLLLAGVGIAALVAGKQPSPGSGVWESDSSQIFEGVAYAAP